MLREWCDAADNGETCRSIDLRAILRRLNQRRLKAMKGRKP